MVEGKELQVPIPYDFAKGRVEVFLDVQECEMGVSTFHTAFVVQALLDINAGGEGVLGVSLFNELRVHVTTLPEDIDNPLGGVLAIVAVV